MLNACATCCTPQQRASLIARLERADFGAEWELITLYRLLGSGLVAYEPLIEGRRPDILLQPANAEPLVCEVVTVSDEEFRGRRRIAQFDLEARRRVARLGLPVAKFTFHVSSSGPFRNRRIAINLPKGDIEPAFPGEFYSFMEQVRSDPTHDLKQWIVAQDAKYFISYHPNSSYNGQTWCSFAGLPHSKKYNPVTNALQSKRKRLNKLPATLIKGVVLCDGGCDMISRQTSGASTDTWSIQDLIWEFLTDTRSISFVLVQYTPTGGLRPDNRLEIKLYPNDQAAAPLTEPTTAALLQTASEFPPMMFPPYRAWSLKRQGVLGPDTGWYNGTEFRMTKNHREVAIPARLLRDFLAGDIDEKGFRQRIGLNPGATFFHGVTITDCHFESNGEYKDDDWVVVRLEHDPSASQFR